MTCEDCVHYEVCKDKWSYELIPILAPYEGKGQKTYMDGMENKCQAFKPKSRFVEVPCEVGQTVWVIEPYEVWDGSEWSKILTEEKITKMCLIGSYQTRISIEDFGERVFLSREEAEKALAERSK